MSKPEFSKPFDSLDAKAGAPYCCRDGQPATVLKWDGRRFNEPLVGCIGVDDVPASWGSDGRYVPDEHCQRPRDLIMLPLGFIDGKPVFVGDEYLGIADTPAKAEPKHAGMLFTLCKWPVLAPEYPVFNGSVDMLSIEYSKNNNYAESLVRVANAAIRYAIDAGKTVFPDSAPSDDLLMKVAKEVWCRATGQEHFLNEKEQYFRAIITSVTSAKDAKEGAK